MNEKFLSRGKRKEHDFYGLGGEWVYGIPIQTHIGTFICFEENPHYCGQYGYMEIEELSKVIPETVGRCTGLLDKNGKMIFEGDIVKSIWQHMGDTDTVTGIVKYDNAAFFLETDDHYLFFEDNIFSAECEVIGNIYDAPEMIGGEKNER